MVNLPSLRQLQYLLVLHKYQHFGKAAKASFVSQSTLSAAILQLEELLECQLLERSHKTFIFTPLGEEVVIEAKALIHSSIDLLKYTRSQSQPMSGKLVLGCIPTIAPFVLSHISKATVNKYPDLQLLLREDTSDNLLTSLSRGDIDMAIMALPYKTEGFSEIVMADDQFHMVLHKQVAEQFPSCEMKRLPPSSIFLLDNEHCLSQHSKQMCKLVDQRKINPFSATSLQTLVQMVDTHKGVTFLPQMAINSHILQGTDLLSRRVEPTGAHRKIALLWRRSNKRVDTFVNLSVIVSEIVRAKCLRPL